MSFGLPAPQLSEATVVEEYVSKHLLPASTTPDSALQYALSNSVKNGLPPISVSPSQGKFLKIQCQLQRAKNILEIGTLGGYSTIWFAESVKDAYITSIEVDPKHRNIALENIWYAGLSQQVDLILGAALDVLPKLAREVEERTRPKFDFVFINADWEEYVSKHLLPALTTPDSALQYALSNSGHWGGYSTIWFAESVKDAHITSIEVDPKHRNIALENIWYVGLSQQVDLILGATSDVLPKLAREVEERTRPKFDFVFIDADWGEQWDYFDWATKMMKAGSCIYVDNVVRQLLDSGVTDEGADTNSEPVAGMKRLVERVGRETRVDAVVIQTVGAKSYDGFLMAVVVQ